MIACLTISDIPADVVPGTRREAQLHALAQNTSHGLRRTNEDKRRAVTMMLEDGEWRTWNDRQIAEHLCVSLSYVHSIRTQLSTVESSQVRRTGKDGKSYPSTYKKPEIVVNSGNQHDLGDTEQSDDDDFSPDVPTEIEADAPRTVQTHDQLSSDYSSADESSKLAARS